MNIASLPRLNLPAFDVRLRATSRTSEDAEVYDPLRRKWVALTPEEWVRQHFVNMLVTVMGYSPHRIANEIGLRLNNTRRRCDTVVYDNTIRPAVIVEYKAPHIALTQRVFDQIARYNMVLDARFLIVSNGMTHYCCRIFDTEGPDEDRCMESAEDECMENYGGNDARAIPAMKGYEFMSRLPDYAEVSGCAASSPDGPEPR